MLARALVGVLPLARGTIRLDGATLEQWTPDVLGTHIGYLPQDVQLFDGSIGENIARFEPDAAAGRIIAAAEAAGADRMIRQFAQGYETRIGDHGSDLSAGQRQRIALARALYGDPFLVVLDEPNANLDAEGDAALTKAILRVRRRGGIVIVIAHRPSALAGLDQLLVMGNGRVQAFGPRDQILERTTRRDHGKPIKASVYETA
jgi:ATP-binding cassette, subfamily C, type I secretion system permease/ATPase